MEITFTKRVKTGITSWEVTPPDLNSCALTGTTAAGGFGVFTGPYRACQVTFSYGSHERIFAFAPYWGENISPKEAKKAFLARVSAVREWVVTLPKDTTEEITFDV